VPTPAIIAHRGASREAPENTIAAFDRALALGADGIELDVHATSDGHVVVHHDPAPPARAIGGTAKPFRELTLAAVRAITVDGHSIPTLSDVLELIGDRLTVYCELKGAGVVEAAAPLLAAHRGPCAMHSFDHRAVRRAADLAPGVPRGILVVSRLIETISALDAAQAETLWPQREYVDAELVAELHERGRKLVAWTVNDPLEARRLSSMHVDCVCTDDVAGIRAALSPTIEGHIA
jgi:glycerophosphoryl diester phosphodiesterase